MIRQSAKNNPQSKNAPHSFHGKIQISDLHSSRPSLLPRVYCEVYYAKSAIPLPSRRIRYQALAPLSKCVLHLGRSLPCLHQCRTCTCASVAQASTGERSVLCEVEGVGARAFVSPFVSRKRNLSLKGILPNPYPSSPKGGTLMPDY